MAQETLVPQRLGDCCGPLWSTSVHDNVFALLSLYLYLWPSSKLPLGEADETQACIASTLARNHGPNFLLILTAVNASWVCLPYQIHNHAVGATRRAITAHQEIVMSHLIRTSAITLAILSSVGFAAAQRTPSSDHPDLTPTQQRTVSQGLANSPSQSAPAAQPQVGDKMPDSMTAQSLPSNVTDQVPEAKNLRGKEPVVREAAGPRLIDRSG
jgi:hypothetical protein